MKTTELLIAPSKKERVDTFVDLMSKDEKFKKDYANFKIWSFSKPKDVEEITKNLDSLEKEYGRFASEFGGTNSSIRNRYISELKKKGFNMMIDDADAGVISSAPIIVFDRAKSLEVIAIKPVTNEYIKKLKKDV